MSAQEIFQYGELPERTYWSIDMEIKRLSFAPQISELQRQNDIRPLQMYVAVAEYTLQLLGCNARNAVRSLATECLSTYVLNLVKAAMSKMAFPSYYEHSRRPSQYPRGVLKTEKRGNFAGDIAYTRERQKG